MSKKKGGEHHGGAWKVAYADFVTAMMALFMVLWIIGQNQEVIQATADYFKDPIAYEHEVLMGQRSLSGEGAVGAEDTGVSKFSKDELKKLADSIYQTLNVNAAEKNKPLDIFITPDGIQILIYDLVDKHVFDETGKALTSFGDLMIRSLSWTLDQYKGYLDISYYDPDIKDEKTLAQLQTILRKEKSGNSSNMRDDNWFTSEQNLQSIFEKLVYHGFSLNKIQTLVTQTILPQNAQHNTKIIDLSLHVNTETIRKK